MKYIINPNYKTFHKSCKDILNINNSQYYHPILSLYINYHNTKKSFKKIHLDNIFNIYKILEKNEISELTSNIFVEAIIYNNKINKYFKKDIFCKIISLLDPIHTMMNHYQLNKNQYNLLPNNYIYNTQSKINSMNNSAYIDTFFSYIASNITLKKNYHHFLYIMVAQMVLLMNFYMISLKNY